MRNIARFFISLSLLSTSIVFADSNAPTPSTELSPDQVVLIVVDALKHNDPANADNGIAKVYEFASPGNKSSTGPIERFTRMIKSGFSNMLNHVDSEFGPMEVNDKTALQAVWLTTSTGQEVGYVFQIGKQSGGEFDGMWMTESVWPIGERKPQGQSI